MNNQIVVLVKADIQEMNSLSCLPQTSLLQPLEEISGNDMAHLAHLAKCEKDRFHLVNVRAGRDPKFI
jgi:hypothetical protein